MEQFEPERLHRLEPGQHGVFAGPPPLVGAGLDLKVSRQRDAVPLVMPRGPDGAVLRDQNAWSAAKS